MRNIAVLAIVFYQTIISPTLKQLVGVSSTCRFSPSCSQYAKISINRFGVLKGGCLSIVRILRCQPYFKF